MKNNVVYTSGAVISTVFNYFKMSDIADKIQSCMSDNGFDVSITDTKVDGIIFRHKRDSNPTNDDVYRVLVEVFQSVMGDEDSELSDYMEDTYDMKYKPKMITVDSIRSVLEVHRTGRQVTIEFDNF